MTTDVYGSLGAIGAAEPAYSVVPPGLQQLSPTAHDDVLTLLNKRVLVTDPVTPPKGMFSFWAVTMERLAELNLPTSEATKNAGAYVMSLPPTHYALANTNDVLNLATVADFRITIAPAADVPYVVGPNSPLAILHPLAPVESGTTTAPAAEKKKFSVITPILGAGVGLLVGGPVGAAVGAAVGLGVEAVRTA